MADHHHNPPSLCHHLLQFKADHQKQARILAREVRVDYPPDLDSYTSYITIQKMMQELYKAMVEKMVMENAALCAALKAENKTVKRELEDLRKEIVGAPSSVPDGTNETSPLQTGDGRPVPKEQKRFAQPATENQVASKNQDLGQHQSKTPEHALPAHPGRYFSSKNTIAVPTIASIAAKNAHKPGKLREWTIVAVEGPKKNDNTKLGTTFPPPTKTSEESKRYSNFPQVGRCSCKIVNNCAIFITRCKHDIAEYESTSTYPLSQKIAEAMLSRVEEVCLRTALRFNGDISDISANQLWIYLKAHSVELARYYDDYGLKRIREEAIAGPSAIDFPFTPQWVSGLERMQYYSTSGSKKHSLIYFTVKTASEADRIIKQRLHFGGRYHKVESYRRVGPDMICPKCCHWGHTTYGCATPEKVRCAICAESHLTIDHKCPISYLLSPDVDQTGVSIVKVMAAISVPIAAASIRQNPLAAPIINKLLR
ncbi:hypothetical protein EPUL_000572 [Erysiphe pulchra]|uniref:Uncharacterized protein n=1 Tax=Erysiphe pulchra TaxID=225359 RepID=A0A2S4PWD4_9PEZI|nr:hypothetical protein EPUL_000572 [Erysiphe pulchra]